MFFVGMEKRTHPLWHFRCIGRHFSVDQCRIRKVELVRVKMAAVVGGIVRLITHLLLQSISIDQMPIQGIEQIMTSRQQIQLSCFVVIQQSPANIFLYNLLIQKNQMELRTIQRSNTLTSLNKKATLKPLKMKENDKQKENQSLLKPTFWKHPAFQYIRATTATAAEFKKFATLLYKGLFYSVNNLKGPSLEYIAKKKVHLPEPSDVKQKFLMLDLDETLIHSVFTADKTDVRFTHKGEEFRFNMRPGCLQFLATMSQYYTIYVFTAGTQAYAEPIVAYLNQKRKTIHGLLHRRNCMETQNGFFIKDLRIIANRDLKDIIIVDNLVHSFGLQLTNGVPILEFLQGTTDNQFGGMEKLLIEASSKEDVREYLSSKLKLKELLEIDEQHFLNMDEEKKV